MGDGALGHHPASSQQSACTRPTRHGRAAVGDCDCVLAPRRARRYLRYDGYQMSGLAPSTKYMHIHLVIACADRRSPHCQRSKDAMWLAASPIQSGQLQPSNDATTHSSSPLVSLPTPSPKLKARSRGARQLGGRLESNLTGCACRPETYTTRLFRLLLTQWLASTAWGRVE